MQIVYLYEVHFRHEIVYNWKLWRSNLLTLYMRIQNEDFSGDCKCIGRYGKWHATIEFFFESPKYYRYINSISILLKIYDYSILNLIICVLRLFFMLVLIYHKERSDWFVDRISVKIIQSISILIILIFPTN